MRRIMEKRLQKTLIRIVDDDTSFSGALKFLLETDGWCVECYSGGRDFLVGDSPSVLGCVILDVAMPGMSGLEVLEEMRSRGYATPVIFLSGHGDLDMAVQAMKDGAVDFIQKPLNESRLLEAVAKAVKWDESHRGWTIESTDEIKRFDTLTNREKQVIRLVASGLINKEIAERLSLSERTVEVHRQNASRKLKLQSVSDITRLLSHIDEKN